MLNLNRQLNLSWFTGIYDTVIPKDHLLYNTIEIKYNFNCHELLKRLTFHL